LDRRVSVIGRRTGAGLLALLVVAGPAMGLAACGGGDDDAPAAGAGSGGRAGPAKESVGGDAAPSDAAPGGGFDPCALLEPGEIEARFGAEGPVHDGVVNGSVCSWVFGPEGADGGDGFVSLTVVGVPSGMTAEQQYRSFRDASGTASDVAGVGDEAYTEGGGNLLFRSGDAFVALQTGFPGDGDRQPGLVALAELVIRRL
jgi:hypothetical protein